MGDIEGSAVGEDGVGVIVYDGCSDGHEGGSDNHGGGGDWLIEIF